MNLRWNNRAALIYTGDWFVTEDFDDVETDAAAGTTSTGLRVIITVNGAVITAPLPALGEVKIGRSTTNDVTIDHASVSRAHITLRVSPLEVVDVGSRNGTHVRGERIQPETPVPISVGEVVQVGDAMLLVQTERISRPTIERPPPPMPPDRRSSGRISSPTLVGERMSSSSLPSAVADLERARILDALDQCGGNQTRAARLLGISRNTLLARLDEYGLPRPRKA